MTFRHPYCPFCQKYYYNEESFSWHLKQAYLQCHLCCCLSNKPACAEHKALKYVYYKNQSSLKSHFKQSHFLCEQCQENSSVFETMGTLEIHMAKNHQSYYDKKTQRFQQNHITNHNLHNMTGFYYNEQKGGKSSVQLFRLKDREGASVEDQLIRREKELREKDNHKDEAIDLRNFTFYDSDELEQRLAQCKVTPDDEDISMEDVKMFKYQALVRLPASQLKAKLENYLEKQSIVQVHVLLVALANKQIDENSLVTFLR